MRLVEQAVPALGVSTDWSGVNREGEIFFDFYGDGRKSAQSFSSSPSPAVLVTALRAVTGAEEGLGLGLVKALIGGSIFPTKKTCREIRRGCERIDLQKRWFFCFTAKAKACARHGKRRRVEIRGKDDDDRRIGNRQLMRALFTED
ncbi:hypothetical protein U1Q18_008872 [Sarracenia purpurea var. burkii]